MITPGLAIYWRKYGPCDWYKVLSTQFHGDKWYDGGLPGVSVAISYWTKKGQCFRRHGFIPSKNPEDFKKLMRRTFRRQAGRAPRLKKISPYYWRPNWKTEADGKASVDLRKEKA